MVRQPQFYNRTQIINMTMVATMNLKRPIKNNMVMAQYSNNVKIILIFPCAFAYSRLGSLRITVSHPRLTVCYRFSVRQERTSGIYFIEITLRLSYSCTARSAYPFIRSSVRLYLHSISHNGSGFILYLNAVVFLQRWMRRTIFVKRG